jgi:hypothetical protein
VGFSWSRNPIGICRTCFGQGYIDEYRLFDPKKPASRLQRILQTIVGVALVLLCLSYVSHIMQNVDALHQEREPHTNPSSARVAYSGGAYVPLIATDLPAQCAGPSSGDACRDAVEEFRAGYGAIKCGYNVNETGRTRFYFFWLRKVPSHLVAMVRNDPKASIRALGSTAVQECPATQDAAEALYRQNNR